MTFRRFSILTAAAALLLCVTSATSATSAGAKDKNPHARFPVVGILVNSEIDLPTPSDKDAKQEAFLGQRPGTTLAVVLSGIKGGMIELDRKKSKVTKFSGSTGSDLLVKEKFGGPFEMGSTTWKRACGQASARWRRIRDRVRIDGRSERHPFAPIPRLERKADSVEAEWIEQHDVRNEDDLDEHLLAGEKAHERQNRDQVLEGSQDGRGSVQDRGESRSLKDGQVKRACER